MQKYYSFVQRNRIVKIPMYRFSRTYAFGWAWSLALMESRDSGGWTEWQRMKYFIYNVIYYYHDYRKDKKELMYENSRTW